MGRTIKIKKPRESVTLSTPVNGYILVPLDQWKEGYPRAQSNVLAATYYRVHQETGKCRAFVTVMPDRHRVAWDTCSKCHSHVTVCKCPSGVYHPSSVAFIRATFDHDDWPTVRITDYSEYFDPYMRGNKRDEPIKFVGPKRQPQPVVEAKPEKTRRQTAQVAAAAAITESEAFGLTATEIENIDMAEVNAQAETSARKVIKKVRAQIKRRRKSK